MADDTADNNNYNKMEDLIADVLGNDDNEDKGNNGNGNENDVNGNDYAVVEMTAMKTTMSFSPCSRKNRSSVV